MAKRGKYHKVSRFSFEGFDMAHIRTTEQYARVVQTLFDRAAADVAANAAKITPGDKPFSFADYPSARKYMEGVAKDLTANVTTTIERGSRKEWLFACAKNDTFIDAIFDTTKLSKATLRKLQNRNLDALNTFQTRKADGMDLSQRVWKYVGEWKEHMELAIDAGLGEGTSAAQLARDVKQDLRDPNRLFRRVRDRHGNLHLSKAARAYHPGQGVYRSSARNAQRLARTEINMAYRESDFRRWQQLDFIVGIEIARSNHEPHFECPLCDRLAGKYPKTFRFRGWHPQCMCHVTPILMDDETFDANELGELRAALRATEYHAQQAKNIVTDVPAGFKDWAQQAEKQQANWAHTPYFVRDNFKNGKIADGLSIELPVVDVSGKVEYHVPYEQLPDTEKKAWEHDKWILAIDYDLEMACRLYGVDLSGYESLAKEIINNNQYWRKSELTAEFARLENVLMGEIAAKKKQAEQIIAKFKQASENAKTWVVDNGSNAFGVAERNWNAEQSEKYPNYIQFVKSKVLNDVAHLDAKADKAKQAYRDAISQGNAAIAKYDKSLTADLQRVLNDRPTESYPAEMLTADILSEIQKLTNPAGVFVDVINELKRKNVEYRPVGDLPKPLTHDEIVAKIGGGDMTQGSCASVGLVYAANHGGLDVLDFRGGISREHFASHPAIYNIVEKVGGITARNDRATQGRWTMKSGIELMKTTQVGKMYYLAIARHAAIVRQVAAGKYEFLELQSSRHNGWKPLNAQVFASRFSARGREYSYSIVDIERLCKEPSFRTLMGYINTAQDKQLKGASGTIK